MAENRLDGRLSSVARLVRQGAVFCDIGTDHAYLPIFLLKTGRIERAVLTDINEGPLLSARTNIESEGLSGRVEFFKTDGALGLDGLGITDYAVCGMGGELIARIVKDAPHMARNGVQLILQPMTKHAALRKELYSLGYTVERELYSYAEGKYYLCLLASYTGEKRVLTEVEYELGEAEKIDTSPEYYAFLSAKARTLEKQIRGRSEGGFDTSRLVLIQNEITERLRKAGIAK